ncbi:MAG: hypothetical protein H6977_11825 [Gammaproteobacteria bacterium]|nr:hypothetical protein [Gammaproteobacteria bacterium]
MNLRQTRCFLAGALWLAGTPAFAATLPTQWGVSASTYWADCSFLPTCDQLSFLSGNPINETSSQGGLNQASASQIDVAQNHNTLVAGNVDMGTASAAVELDLTPGSPVSVPTLRAAASSNSWDGWVGGLAFALAGYDYTGPADVINLSATLTGTVTNAENSDTTGLSLGIWIIRDDGSLAFPSPPPADLNALALYVAGLPVEDLWLAEDLAQGETNKAVNLTTVGDDIISIAFSDDDILAGNTSFYVMAALSASATAPGQSAISMSTLTMNFDKPAQLVAASAVPLPPAVGLMGLALAALARRRRQGV